MKKIVILMTAVCCSALSALVILSLTAFGQDAVTVAAPNNAISIPACAFQEIDNSYDFRSGFTLFNKTGTASYFAPVNLPHGATIRKIKIFCIDHNSGNNIVVDLRREKLDSNFSKIGTVKSSGSESGFRIFSSTAISPRLVNNFKNSYLVTVYLPGTNAEGYAFSQVKILFDSPLAY